MRAVLEMRATPLSVGEREDCWREPGAGGWHGMEEKGRGGWQRRQLGREDTCGQSLTTMVTKGGEGC